jgi:vitamin B12 transporter
MKRLLFSGIFLLFGLTVLAQQEVPVIISILDSATSTPLNGATLRVKDLNKTFLTNYKGQASFSVKPGNYVITLSHVGYQSEQIILKATEEQKADRVLKLREVATLLNDVSIASLSKEQEDAKAIKRSVMPVTVISGSQIENRAGDLNEILERQAGVQVKETGGLGSASHISVRGLEGKRVEIYIDGNPLNSPDGSLSINDIPLQFIERIEIYKGTIPAYLVSLK